jgi:hypothetical protein
VVIFIEHVSVHCFLRYWGGRDVGAGISYVSRKPGFASAATRSSLEAITVDLWSSAFFSKGCSSFNASPNASATSFAATRLAGLSLAARAVNAKAATTRSLHLVAILKFFSESNFYSTEPLQNVRMHHDQNVHRNE